MSEESIDRAIARAEAELGITFPAAYADFLREGRHPDLPPGAHFYALGGEWDLLAANRWEREQSGCPLPGELVAFYDDGMGNQLCFDTRSRREDGEYPVVFWDHEISPEENLAASARPAATPESAGRVAGDFRAWLEWLAGTQG